MSAAYQDHNDGSVRLLIGLLYGFTCVRHGRIFPVDLRLTFPTSRKYLKYIVR
jgi:hypothetical protein